jgi:hypothetical protein
MIREAKDSYPGIAALPLGYVPIGNCGRGSGDPYFYRASDGAIVRIPHDATSFDHADASLDESAVELVARSVEALVAAASLDDPAPEVDDLLN